MLPLGKKWKGQSVHIILYLLKRSLQNTGFEMIKYFHNWKMKKHYQLFSYESYVSMKMHLSLTWITCSLSCQQTCHLLAEPLSDAGLAGGEPGCHRLQEGNGSATVGKNWTWDPHTSHVSSMYHNTQISYTLVAEEVLRFVLLNSQQDKLQRAHRNQGCTWAGHKTMWVCIQDVIL